MYKIVRLVINLLNLFEYIIEVVVNIYKTGVDLPTYEIYNLYF